MPHSPPWNRRELLLAMGAAAIWPRSSWALGDRSQLDVAELHIPGATIHRPNAWKRLLFEVIQSTSVEATPRTVKLSPEDPALFNHPFSVLVGQGALPPLSDAAVRQIESYLTYGGFLLIDDASGSGDGAFARSIRDLCRRLFPTRPLSALPADHAIYRSFFMLDGPIGRTQGTGYLEGITLGPTTPLVFCGADLSGALDRSPDGRDRFPVVPGGESQRREALKLSVNLVLYALTSNYKHDIAHVLELMREGRIE